MHQSDFYEEVESLKQVLERLDDRAISALREYISSSDPGEKEMERKIHRARRAITKAIFELDGSATLG
jgi:DNA replication initiation complex subunit (GINS family)